MPHLVSVIMPALNEADCIVDAVKNVPLAEFMARGLETEIIVVDNGSTDGTGELARGVGARVVSEPRRGYGYAYLCGFRAAKGDIICTLDADCSYPAADLPQIVEKLLTENLDFISTDRFHYMYNGVMPTINKVGNVVLNIASWALFGLPFRDSQSGMWIFRSELLDRMCLKSCGMALSQEIKIEAAWRLKARCVELPIHYGYRKGIAKLRVWHDGVGNFSYLIRKRFDRDVTVSGQAM